MDANIFDIYRGTTHDGPGIRDTVFFKGCPLACTWCHNPEGISFSQQVWWEKANCIGCFSCIQSCPQQAIHPETDGLIIDSSKCIACQSCVESCPSKAMQAVSKPYSVSELIKELERDKIYFEQFGGGVTASGGECMMQSNFLAELFKQLHIRGITTAIDTSGEAPYEAFKKVLPYTDYVLYDLKLFDPDLHKQHTGVTNKRILSNFQQLLKDQESGAYHFSIWVRTPLIPFATADSKNIQFLAKLLLPHLGIHIERWELCAFNNTCTPKYRKLQKDWVYAETKLLTRTEAEVLRDIAISSGCDPERVVLTGILTDK